MKDFTPQKYQNHIPCICIDDKFTKPLAVFKGKNAAYEFIKVILKECGYCKKIMKKHFNTLFDHE